MDLDREMRSDDAPSTASKQPTVNAGMECFSRAVTINREAAELYEYWRDFSNLPQVMDNLVSITVIDDETSEWVAKGPAGTEIAWRARVIEDIKGAMITWCSDDDADVFNKGRITFSPAQGQRGTIVTALMAYDPPAGFVGRMVAKVLQSEPEVQLRRDLRRFKQLMETGEIATNVRNRAQFVEEGK